MVIFCIAVATARQSKRSLLGELGSPDEEDDKLKVFDDKAESGRDDLKNGHGYGEPGEPDSAADESDNDIADTKNDSKEEQKPEGTQKITGQAKISATNKHPSQPPLVRGESLGKSPLTKGGPSGDRPSVAFFLRFHIT